MIHVLKSSSIKKSYPNNSNYLYRENLRTIDFLLARKESITKSFILDIISFLKSTLALGYNVLISLNK